jgi:pimeloyl-ACP methyl ester carboxylesterase
MFIIRWFLRGEATGRVDLTDMQRLELMLSPARLASITNEKDLEIFQNEDFLRVALRATRTAYAQGYDWVRQDGRAMSMPWGRIEDIRPDLPVQLWYGKNDTFVPLNHGQQIAKHLGEKAELRVEDDSHASISVD